ncbi:MAG: hypothetical protein ACHQAY_23575 [Hyphomicrobiales bacterium]
MKIGDHVRFRRQSRAWQGHGLEPDAKGYVTEIYGDPDVGEMCLADVMFSGWPEPERGIRIDELEIVDTG